MNEVVLHGELAEVYGGPFRLDVRDAAEAVRALSVQLVGFSKMVRDLNFHVIREVPGNKFALDEDTLLLGMANTRLHLIPVVEGASTKKKGGIKLVLGIALVAGAIIFPPAGAIAGMSIKSMMILGGAALALSGAALLLSPQLKLDEGKEDDSSKLFGGSPDTSGQNIPIPIAYGRCRLRAIPIATQIVVNEFSATGIDGQEYDGKLGGLVREAIPYPTEPV